MKFILTPEQMRKADFTAIEQYNIPSLVLMENASRSAAKIISKILKNSGIHNPSLLFFCGSGNNGGDGFAIARHLHEKYKLTILWIGDPEKMSPETEVNYRSVLSLGISCKHLEGIFDLDNVDLSADCVIDSLIGVGGSEKIKGIANDLLHFIREMDVLKIAIDAPTGLNTETGAAHPSCFKANHTITMYSAKTGMLLNKGIFYCGKIHEAYLGAPTKILKKLSDTFLLEEEDIKNLLPVRDRISSKFDYGRVMVIAGSERFPGASALSSNASIVAGAGLVNLYTTSIHSSLLPEIIPCKLTATTQGSIALTNFDFLLSESAKANAVLIGPGLSDVPETIELVKKLIEKLDSEKPLIIDADALKAINPLSKLRKNIIITPHTGEFSQLTGIPRKDIELNPAILAKEWSQKFNCIVHLKHVPSIITNGSISYWNINGNPGMASAGMGDVLAGIIAAFVAQGIEPLIASSLSAYLHAASGDKYVGTHSQMTLTASSLIESFVEIMAGFE